MNTIYSKTHKDCFSFPNSILCTDVVCTKPDWSPIYRVPLIFQQNITFPLLSGFPSTHFVQNRFSSNKYNTQFLHSSPVTKNPRHFSSNYISQTCQLDFPKSSHSISDNLTLTFPKHFSNCVCISAFWTSSHTGWFFSLVPP